MSEWGWVRYERTHWQREDGRKLYIGHFKQDNDLLNWTAITVRFWARHPVKAMSIIANSDDPSQWRDKVVN